MGRAGKNGKSAETVQHGEVRDSRNEAAVRADTAERPAPSSRSERPELPSEARAKLGAIRGRIEVSVGQLTLLMMQLPRYRHQSLADLNHLVIEPLLRDRVAIAYVKGEEEQPSLSNPAPVGAAIWASVSDEVHLKIQEQVKAGTFPVRLNPDDWSSGDRVWLLDLLGISRKAASAVLMNFKQIAGERDVHMHPIVAGAVDPDLLSKIKKS